MTRLLLLCLLLSGCASTQSTAGFTKDQKAQLAIENQKQRTAWSLFGITVATKLVDVGVNAGLSAFSNGGNERKLPRTFEK